MSGTILSGRCRPPEFQGTVRIEWTPPIPNGLTRSQTSKWRVALVALEEFGAGLTRLQIDDVMLAIFEHISGFEALPGRLDQYRKILALRGD